MSGVTHCGHNCHVFSSLRSGWFLALPYSDVNMSSHVCCVILTGLTERKLLYRPSIWKCTVQFACYIFPAVPNNNNSKPGHLQSYSSSVLYWLSHFLSANILIFLSVLWMCSDRAITFTISSILFTGFCSIFTGVCNHDNTLFRGCILHSQRSLTPSSMLLSIATVDWRNHKFYQTSIPF